MRYSKPRRFPRWMKINSNKINTNRYKVSNGFIKADFDDNSDLPHCNHIEMAGFYTSCIISYLVNEKRELKLYRFCVFPTNRVNPNNTHGSLTYAFKGVDILQNSNKEKIDSVSFNGILCFNSTLNCLNISRKFVVAVDKKALIEKVEITNLGGECEIELKNISKEKIIKKRYTPNKEKYVLKTQIVSNDVNVNSNKIKLSKDLNVIYFIYSIDELTANDAEVEIFKREKFLIDNKNRLIITTPDNEINQMLEFTKLRSSESIFKTKNGYMHAPGGGGFYAAMWTNDQCEYANVYFAYLGYDVANEQSINCYNLFSKFVKSNKVIPSSIIAEGDDIWDGAGDRGDNSMYVYGFTRYLLTSGDKNLAEKYISNLEIATEYILSQMNEYNVIKSDADELENRFESGKVNLSTSSISYDALLSMSYLEKELGNDEKADFYLKTANKIKDGINTYFGKNVEGYNTYMYCKEESKLRSWICLPLCVGIFDKKDDTIKALVSDKLKMGNGVLTRSGEKTYWDRTTLYTLRGLYNAGNVDEATNLLKTYTHERLTSEHVPYPVEAFPEGNASHLSAESALYVRIIIEGMLGYRPVGFNKFIMKINLPAEWNKITVEKFNVCQKVIDIKVSRIDSNIKVEIDENNTFVCKENEEIVIEI